MKLSLEDKKEIIRLYFDEHIGIRPITKRFSIDKSRIKTIISWYRIHGEDY